MQVFDDTARGNKRFQYRAYHPPTHEVYEVKCIDFTGECDYCEGIPCVVLKLSRSRSIIAEWRYIILQEYTGFKDIHGTKIFEGDIVVACIDLECKIKVKGIVGFYFGAFGIQCTETIAGRENHDNEIFDLEELHNVEIVGNYYKDRKR